MSAIFSIDHQSSVLNGKQHLHVLMPGSTLPPLSSDRYPTLWLFHGRGEAGASWLEHSSLPRLAEQNACALVMPTIRNNTRYADAVDGDRNWSYISEELPAFLETRLALATDRAHRFAAGFSIGGLAALKLGLACPDRFDAVCSLAGALQLDYGELLNAAADNPERTRWLRSVYGAGSTFAQPEDRLLEVAATAVAAGTELPRIQLRCGRQDGSAYYNRRVRDQLQSLGVPVEYVEEEGAHDRTYCERVLPSMFDFFTRCAKCSAALPSRRCET